MIRVPVSFGELFDKVTILEIKRDKMDDAAKLVNVRKELTLLEELREPRVEKSQALEELVARLKEVNTDLWEIEDAIRDCERRQEFGDDFVSLARSVYKKNDERSRLKREINELLDSEIVEEKSYRDY